MNKDTIEQMLKASAMSDRLVNHILTQLIHYEVVEVVNPAEYKYRYPKDTKTIFIFLMSPETSQWYKAPPDTVYAVRRGKSGHLYNYTPRFQVWKSCVEDSHKMIVLKPVE